MWFVLRTEMKMLNKSESLTPKQLKILVKKGTEFAGTGKYIINNPDLVGTFICRQCGIGLFTEKSHFRSSCGWPSFDDSLLNNVQKLPDKDGRRTEIVCRNCNGHLGHVFYGENYTAKNARFCVNSISIEFVPEANIADTEEIMVAGGCFWGVELLMQKIPGVLITEVGYIGGSTKKSDYRLVCSGKSGHSEAVRVVFDPLFTNVQELYKNFFEIHDFTQVNGQGPDHGDQYKSKIFYYNNNQKCIAEKLIGELTEKGYKVATTLLPVSTFWAAEEYHQNYYLKTRKSPYCHMRRDIF